MKKEDYKSPERDYYKIPESSWIMRKLWKCSGGDPYILVKATYADQIKYACLGGIIIATGGMAALAGGYAFYTIFCPKDDGGALIDSPLYSLLSSLFGIVWGLIIFNIDRFIVTSTGKGDGTEKITREEFIGAIPRLIMGIIIAITISKPLEIRMFQTEIQSELIKKKGDQESNYAGDVEKRYKGQLDRLDVDILGLRNQIKNKEDKKTDAEDAAIIVCGSKDPNCRGHIGPWNKFKSADSDYQLTLNQNNSRIALLNTDRDTILSTKKRELLKAKKDGEKFDGLFARISILHEIASREVDPETGKIKHCTPWIIYFVTLLFLAIELTPIFFKLMLTKSPYDYLTENRDDLIKAENGIEVKYDFYKDKEGLERHLIIHHAKERMLNEKILLSNAEKLISEYAVNKYIEREKKKIDEDNDSLGGYIISPKKDA